MRTPSQKDTAPEKGRTKGRRRKLEGHENDARLTEEDTRKMAHHAWTAMPNAACAARISETGTEIVQHRYGVRVGTHSAINATITAPSCANAYHATQHTFDQWYRQASVTISPAVRMSRHTQSRNGQSILRRTDRVQHVSHQMSMMQIGRQEAV